jgi:two-component system, chemotaxis family, response regulator Rcp1
VGGSGSNPNPEKDPLSASPSPCEDRAAKRLRILIVEDNAADVFLIRQAIKAANMQTDIHVVKDGEQAVRFFDEADRDHGAPCPDLAILDINLPRKQGDEVLQHMRRSPRCAKALVIAVSTSASLRDREEMTKLGANAYFRKPSDYAEFMKLGDVIKSLFDDPRNL